MNLIIKTFSWFAKLISDSTETSHKRFISVISFFVLVAMVVLYSCKLPISSELIYTFTFVCLGQSYTAYLEKKNVPKI